MPNFEELNIKAHQSKLNLIEKQHKEGEIYTKVEAWSASYYDILKEFAVFTDKGYKVDANLSARATTYPTYKLIAHLPENEITESLNKMIAKEKADFEIKIKELKELWLEENLQGLIDEKEKEIQAQAEQDKESRKAELFSKLLG